MAEEISDVRRALPRVLILSASLLAGLYVVVNLAFLSVLSPEQMASSRFVASDVMEGLFGPVGRRLMAGLSLLVFLAALSSALLATVRVTFALARDGLTFPILARMSERQAPVPALLLVGGIAAAFSLVRDFQQILNIYFLAAAILFGLSYGSLLVFRFRDHRAGRPFPEHAFRCPGGVLMASGLILLQAVLALRIVYDSPKDSLYTLGLLASFGVLYRLWRRRPG
jgi:APA family basic amino acid/polyamine antiporter